MFEVWTGGDCPVEDGVLVDVIHRDGETFFNQNPYIDKSKASDWSHADRKSMCDIIAWRIAQE